MLDYSYRTILTVALPLMLSSFIQSIVLITDAAFISRYDVRAFDAVGNGGLVYITFFMCLYGMSDGAQILIARRIGENRTDAISGIFTSSLLIHAVIATAMVLVINWIVPGILSSVTRNPELAAMEQDFLEIRGYALFFAMISLSCQAYFLRINHCKFKHSVGLRFHFWGIGKLRNGLERRSFSFNSSRWRWYAFHGWICFHFR